MAQEQEWPEAKLKNPHTEVRGKVFGPKSDPILYEQDDLLVKVTLTTADWNKEAVKEKKAHGTGNLWCQTCQGKRIIVAAVVITSCLLLFNLLLGC